jgi:DNA-binding XRE family transcriptional regulator
MLQVRNLSPRTRQVLGERAARARQSLSDYVAAILDEQASRPALSEWEEEELDRPEPMPGQADPADVATMTPDWLKHMRKAVGLSQETLARLLGVKRVTVTNWELGRRPIPAGIYDEIMVVKTKLDSLADELERRRAR